MIRKAYFAGGCFWCITPIFRIYGCQKIISGYSGGRQENPTYLQVKKQLTGHRESIEVTYDDQTVGYAKLLKLYLANVDPFDGEGQFIDRGHSYTLAIYYQNEEEKELALKALEVLQEQSGKIPQIALEPFISFYPAEEEHQDFDLKNPEKLEAELIESGRKKKAN